MKFEFQDSQLFLVDGSEKILLKNWTTDKEDPFYLYYLKDFTKRAEFYKSQFRKQDAVHFAMKANSHPKILQAAKRAGLGVDLVSGGELKKALEAGFSPDLMIFSGVGKSKSDLQLAIESQVFQINVESPQELKRIAEVATPQKKVARVAIRFNPDVSADTHPYIRTGFKENKFGMDESFLPELVEILNSNKDALKLTGITLHIGSQIRNVGSLVEAVEKSISVFRYLTSLGFKLETFDVGGGLGIEYEQDAPESEFQTLADFATRVKQLLEPLNVKILTEPGRFLVARCGMLFTQVQYVKRTPFKNFVIVNTGMHHLLRPSLYRAYHRIVPLEERETAKSLMDIVGPVCESSDVLGHDRLLNEPKQGDWLAILDTGAYGAVMSSRYNAFPEVKEYFI